MKVPGYHLTIPSQATARGREALPPDRKERLAIIAPGSKLCGISAYATALRRQLRDAFDVTIFELDQYLLRSRHGVVRKLGDRLVQEICQEIQGFDAVSLQLEHGTLGLRTKDITQRFGWLIAAAPRLSVTFHTLPPPPSFDTGAFVRSLSRLQLKAAARLRDDFRRRNQLSRGVAKQLRALQQQKPVTAIVHNRRDLSDVRYLYGIENVFDHPLAFLSTTEVNAVRATASRRNFPMLDDLPPDAVLVGVFGFLNEYKGIGTAVRALQYLPDNHHLLIFGGVHPQEIGLRQHRHPYISSLFADAYMETTLYDRLTTAEAKGAPQLVVSAEQGLRELLGSHPRDLSARLHFMGALDETDFLSGMAICDAVVFPYLEVGQSASGPISQALELGCRIIASRTHAFLQFAEYHKDAIEFFDIGNHLELAERLLARPQYHARNGLPEFNVETNKATYILANSPLYAPSQRAHSLVRTRAEEPAAP